MTTLDLQNLLKRIKECNLECKNEKNLPLFVLERIDQAKKQAEIGFYDREKWGLVIRDPRTPETKSEDYIVIDFHQFLELLKKSAEPKLKEPSRELRYSLSQLISVSKKIIKLLEEE